jgi:PIN domain nuclease of toxin-antitoxin system
VPDAAVTDTNALLYYAAGPPRLLGKRAAAHFGACDAGTALIYVPAAVIWELAILARVGRADLGRSPRQFFDDLLSKPSFQPLDLTPAQVYDASELGFSRDPFDGLIVAAARSLDLPLITRDEAIHASGAVRILW